MNVGTDRNPPPLPGTSPAFKRAALWVVENRGMLLNRLGPFLALVVIYVLFAISLRIRFPNSSSLFSRDALETMGTQTVIVGAAAVGMTLVIISGGIDLSVGSMIAFSSVVSAFLLGKMGANPFLSLVLGVVAGAVSGLFNGLIITRVKVVPFIVTLGTLLILRGLAKGMAESAPINIDSQWIKGFMMALGPGDRWQLFPPGVWMMLLLAVVFALLLRYTRLGRHTFAIGSNEQTARLCGVSVERVKLMIYALSGACAGLSGVALLSRQGQGDPTGAFGYELDVIAAVVIGGGSLSGGEGSILGSIIGALIMTIIRTGCNLHGLQPWVTQVVTGTIIIVAVALDRLRHRRMA